MFDLSTFVTVTLLLVATVWMSHGVAQLSAAWAQSKQRLSALTATRKHEAKALLKSVEDIERLSAEIQTGRSTIDTTVQVTAERRQKLEHYAPPPPTDIFVTSEFPPSKRDRAWIVRMGPATAPPPGMKRMECYLLVWAGDNAAAMSRGRQLMARRGYDAEAANRLG